MPTTHAVVAAERDEAGKTPLKSSWFPRKKIACWPKVFRTGVLHRLSTMMGTGLQEADATLGLAAAEFPAEVWQGKYKRYVMQFEPEFGPQNDPTDNLP